MSLEQDIFCAVCHEKCDKKTIQRYGEGYKHVSCVSLICHLCEKVIGQHSAVVLNDANLSIVHRSCADKKYSCIE